MPAPEKPSFATLTNQDIYGGYAQASNYFVMQILYRDLRGNSAALVGDLAAARVSRRLMSSRDHELVGVLSRAPLLPIDSQRGAVLLPTAGSLTIPTDPLIRGLDAAARMPMESWRTVESQAHRLTEIDKLMKLLKECSAPLPDIIGPGSPDWMRLREQYAFEIWYNYSKKFKTGNTFYEDGRLAERALRSNILVVHRA